MTVVSGNHVWANGDVVPGFMTILLMTFGIQGGAIANPCNVKR